MFPFYFDFAGLILFPMVFMVVVNLRLEVFLLAKFGIGMIVDRCANNLVLSLLNGCLFPWFLFPL